MRRRVIWVIGQAMVMGALLGVVGCGGGSGSPFQQGGEPFTPAESVMSRHDQIEATCLAFETGGLGDDLVDGDPVVFLAPVEELRDDLYGLARSRSRNDREFLLSMVQSVAMQMAAPSRQSATEQIDYLASYGVHWTGTVSAQVSDSRLSLEVRATGTTGTTRVVLRESYVETDTTRQASLKIEGTLPNRLGGVDTVDIATVVTVRLSSATTGTVTANQTVGFIRRNAGGTEQSRLTSSLQLSGTVTSSGDVTAQLTGQETSGWWVGNGLFWVRSWVDLNTTVRNSGTVRYSGTLRSEASNGMTMSATVASNGGVTGQVRDTSGAVVGTISGNLSTGVTLSFSDGGSTIIA